QPSAATNARSIAIPSQQRLARSASRTGSWHSIALNVAENIEPGPDTPGNDCEKGESSPQPTLMPSRWAARRRSIRFKAFNVSWAALSRPSRIAYKANASCSCSANAAWITGTSDLITILPFRLSLIGDAYRVSCFSLRRAHGYPQPEVLANHV